MFGLWNLLEGVNYSIAWGARAILSNGGLEFLWDRQTLQGNDKIADIFYSMLNESIIPKLKDEVFDLWSKGQLKDNESNLFELKSIHGVKVFFDTNASCGYLYIIVYIPDEDPTNLKTYNSFKGEDIIADGVKWSGDAPIPDIGQHVTVTMNNLGEAKVVSRYINDWVGIFVYLYNPPDWYRDQNGIHGLGLVFGAEIKVSP